MNKKIEIQGKVALVTGANRGIGRTIVEAFLDHGAAKVYAAVRTLKTAGELVEKYGERVVPLHLDLTDQASITAAATVAHDVQVIVNNAAISHVSTPLAADSIIHLGEEFDVNVLGLMRVAQAFAPILKKNEGGAFVQLNSVVSVKCFSEFSTYSASKAAAYSITQGLRDQLGEQGTLVVSVHPGPIATDMGDTLGLTEIANAPELVAEGIVKALREGSFHLFPDPMAQQIWAAYQGFAQNIIDVDLMAG